jgi:hypothetical protein
MEKSIFRISTDGPQPRSGIEATPIRLLLKRSLLTSGAHTSVTATLNDYVHPRVTPRISLPSTPGTRQVLKDATLPVGGEDGRLGKVRERSQQASHSDG